MTQPVRQSQDLTTTLLASNPEQADVRPGEDTWGSQGHQPVMKSELGFPVPGPGLPSAAWMASLEDSVSPEWVFSAEGQEGFPSCGARPALGVSLCDARLTLHSLPCWFLSLLTEWTVSNLAFPLLQCLPAGQLAELPAPGSQLRVGALKWDPPVPVVQCDLPGHSR